MTSQLALSALFGRLFSVPLREPSNTFLAVKNAQIISSDLRPRTFSLLIVLVVFDIRSNSIGIEIDKNGLLLGLSRVEEKDVMAMDSSVDLSSDLPRAAPVPFLLVRYYSRLIYILVDHHSAAQGNNWQYLMGPTGLSALFTTVPLSTLLVLSDVDHNVSLPSSFSLFPSPLLLLSFSSPSPSLSYFASTWHPSLSLSLSRAPSSSLSPSSFSFCSRPSFLSICLGCVYVLSFAAGRYSSICATTCRCNSSTI